MNKMSVPLSLLAAGVQANALKGCSTYKYDYMYNNSTRRDTPTGATVKGAKVTFVQLTLQRSQERMKIVERNRLVLSAYLHVYPAVDVLNETAMQRSLEALQLRVGVSALAKKPPLPPHPYDFNLFKPSLKPLPSPHPSSEAFALP